jgi:1-acyl-sn-glycerol-3-phosphate acyltransferase
MEIKNKQNNIINLKNNLYKSINNKQIINKQTNDSQTNNNQINNNQTNDNQINNANTVVNCSCFCSKCFLTNEKILYILPCSHIVHENCFNNYIIKCQYKNFENKLNNFDKDNLKKDNYKVSLACPQCNNEIKSVLTEYKINSKKKYHQYKIDIKSIRIDNSSIINYMVLPLSIVKFTSLVNKLILVNTEKELFATIEYFLSSFNIKINIVDNTSKNPIEINKNRITWKNKEDNDRKLVIISNHAHYLDSIVIYYLFRCGFVSSDFINQTDIGRIIAAKLKLLIFRRGVDKNMVEKIKEYLNEQKRIVIYPEGAITNNQTMIRFRTGAFYVGEAICPLVIKYDKVIYDDDFNKMLLKLITQNVINVTIYINDFFYPPFDNDKIEKVRDKMITVGKFEKSRVSNKSLKE